jgi:hypothetical protein
VAFTPTWALSPETNPKIVTIISNCFFMILKIYLGKMIRFILNIYFPVWMF